MPRGWVAADSNGRSADQSPSSLIPLHDFLLAPRGRLSRCSLVYTKTNRCQVTYMCFQAEVSRSWGKVCRERFEGYQCVGKRYGSTIFFSPRS
jgi:hypothetical protein